ncbi:MAG TPA: hypothetical protein VKA63_05715, partial [Candidatus Krumholzibacteria bacterium]|nr:hypothetical protein [Candidatus Krumholzibacteria bacterium]
TRIDSLLDEICDKFPSREAPLREALDAHRAGKYFLSTPVILIQADGICQDVLGVQLYSRRSGRPVLARAFEGRSDEAILMSLIAPLLEPLPLTASSKERQDSQPALNRHVVVHGESVDYGKREVSARAISFLAYVTWVLDYSTESL